MSIEFFYNIMIFSSIYFIISSGFNLFLKIRSTIDFSYLAIVIFASYTSVILNNNYEIWLLLWAFISFLLTIPFTLLVLYFSKKLKDIYFAIGTFSIYMLAIEVVRNLEITWWALWISLSSQKLFFNLYLQNIAHFLTFVLIISVLVISFITYLNKTYLFKMLLGWWENELAIKSLSIKSDYYKFVLILITTFLASLWGTINAYYLSYIDPTSFWVLFLTPILMVSLLSFKHSSLYTFFISIFLIWFYELLRLVPIWDYIQIWYYREMIFTFMIMVIAYIVFRRDKVFREL